MLLEELLREEMNPNTALSIFGMTYKDFSEMSLDNLKIKWRNLMKTNHPDLPENRDKGDLVGQINAAYDYLKSLKTNQSQVSHDPLNQPFRRSNEPYPKPAWQPEESFNNKIHVESYRDKNFIKKHIWELSDKSKEIWTIDAYDQNRFGGRLTVYGSKHVFGEMANAMRIYHANGGKDTTQAIFVSSKDEPNKIFMIYCNGIDLSRRPVPLDYRGDSPYKDEKLLKKLPEIIQHVTTLFKRNGRE